LEEQQEHLEQGRTTLDFLFVYVCVCVWWQLHSFHLSS